MASLRLSTCLLLCGVLITWCQIPGGLMPVPVDRADVKEAAKFAIDEYNKISNDKYLFMLKEITKAETQVVEGVIYYMDAMIELTRCEKNQGLNSNCSYCQGQKLCHFKVLEVLWKHYTELLESQCDEI
ncbi:cystatin-like [Polypterus senegalus]|uniref:cystatin-like n=1 Tax=Polypterus senegalus TaxID=55291 RepID=UPI001964228C|nr:cystatin-like [Polypterus senegalus]